MPSQETSADQLLEALKVVVASQSETQRLMQGVLVEVRQQTKPPGSSSIQINAGGISAGLALGLGGVALAAMLLVSFWVMLNLASVREEMTSTRQDLQDQQAAWVAVMQQKVNEVKK